MTNLEALKNLYATESGCYPQDVADIRENAEVIQAIASAKGVTATTVAAENGNTTVFGKKVSTLQSSISVANGAITGTLKFIEGGFPGDGPLSGDGYFLALKFTDTNTGTSSIKLGLVPTIGTGFVELLGDPDMNCVFKITDKSAQVLYVKTTVGNLERIQSFDLSGLTLQSE